VSEELPLSEPPFVYLLWKIHFLTCENISLTLFFFTSFPYSVLSSALASRTSKGSPKKMF
jgi:hypothetical protein